MNLRLQSVCALCWLFLLFGNDKMSSATPSNLMDVDGNLCSSSCYKSIKPILSYMGELKERAETNTKEHLDVRELRQRLVEVSDFREQFKALNQQIEELRKTNEILRESHKQKHNKIKSNDNMKLKVKDLNECIAQRDSLEREIELERKNRIEIEQKHKIIEFKSIEESSIYKTKEEILNNEIKELKSQVSSYKKQLEETQNQLTAKNILVESNSPKIKTIEKDFGECKEKLPKTDCIGLPSGIQTIELPGIDPFNALCNGDLDGGGWIVMQKRFDGSEDFYRNWVEYRRGFGKLHGEFFIGLELLHRITNSERYELYIQMEYFDGKVEFARYNDYVIGNENEKYKLESIGGFNGTTRSMLGYSLDSSFSTYDQDNDLLDDSHVAEERHSGCWCKASSGPNLNGFYYESGTRLEDSMSWASYVSLKSVQMLIRPFQLK